MISKMILAHASTQGLEDAFDSKNRVNLRHFIFQGDDCDHALSDADSEDGVVRVQGSQEVYTPAPLYYLTGMASALTPTKKLGGPLGRKTDDGLAGEVDERADSKSTEKNRLSRIPTCGVFHKFTTGGGVPHTFVGE